MDLITPLGQSGDQIRNVKKLTRPAPNSGRQQALGSKEERGPLERRGEPRWWCCSAFAARIGGHDVDYNGQSILRRQGKVLQSCTPHFAKCLFSTYFFCSTSSSTICLVTSIPRRHFHGHWRLLRGLRTLNGAAARTFDKRLLSA